MDKLKQIILDALVYSTLAVLKFIFLLPFNLWLKAASKLAEQRKNNNLEYQEADGLWPFLTYIKQFAFGFGFDAAIFLSYFIGIILAIIFWFISMLSAEHLFPGLIDGFQTAITIIIYAYMAPIYISLLRDIIQILLIPFRKFLSWGSKPAQHTELEIKNK